jgi:type VI secretion system protein ImpL
MNRFWTLLLDPRVLGVIGLAALATFLFLGADTLKLAATWVVALLVLLLLGWAIVWLVRQWRSRRAAQRLEQAIDQQAEQAAQAAPAKDRAEMTALRTRMQEAVKTIKGSKLGQLRGAAAMYELPWYMVIGNPAAGKSTAVVKSGLKFPFADATGHIIQGIGGTRNCDWFFTNEGILLDTAGRYSVHEEDRSEWQGFLALLKKYRPKAPINGIVIAASVAELAGGRPEQAISLAKSLRQRVQEVTEHLEVFAPVYLVFTKADLIAGFAEFFEDRDRDERERVWGATLPYDKAAREDAVSAFDKRFDELHDGLKELSVARMSQQRGAALPPGVLTFPLEFAALKPALRAFVATLFEENPYQFQPVFRGFYFTSAVQEGSSSSRASDRVARQFGLEARAEHTTAVVMAENGFFLKDLFSKVIFGDRGLVQQYASRRKLRLRAVAFSVAVLGLAAALAGWSWSYLGNRQLMAQVQADLNKVIKVQQERPDLASRLEALDVLQDRIEQLQRYRDDRPLGISLGLYQGEAIDAKLRQEYFAGVRQVMLEPVSQAIEAYLTEVNANPSRLKPMARTPESAATPAREGANTGTRYVDASVEDAGDAYNALKTYLMLGDRQYLEASHLTDQITRFWRGWLDNNRGAMPREQMIRSAERLISFTMAHLQDPAFPQLQNKLALVDQTRENLREQVRGLKGIERVYADVKARAATRFAPITVSGLIGDRDRDLVAGSQTVSGAFTEKAWNGYVEQAFKDAANKELQSADWVLKTAARDDLTLEGSPDQIRKQLTELYKSDYVREWQRFMQGISVAEFGSFERAVERMNRFGDPAESPIRKLMTVLFDQTNWDNPSLLNERLGTAQRGVLDWIKQSLLRMGPSRVEMDVNVSSSKPTEIPMGPIGREFSALSRIMMSRDNAPTPLQTYLQKLSKLRTRFNDIKNQGDPGPGARALMAATLGDGSSELSDALKFVDEQMLNGMTDTARATLRPLLVRPLMQAMAVTVAPAETELNRVWAAQVSEPFQKQLATKYPFDPRSRIEAGPQEIAKLFGPEGAIAKFGTEVLGPMVVRRGDSIVPRTWAEIGVHLRPEFSEHFGSWVAALDGAAAAAGAAPAAGPTAAAQPQAGPDQALFQILPQGSPGIAEYSVTIDGQTLRYRNTAPEWISMVWPNPAGVAGARVSAITNEGKSIELLNEPGRFGLNRLFDLAQSRKLEDRMHELTWSQGPYKVTVHLRTLRLPGEAPAAAPAHGPAPSTTAAVGVGNTRLQGVRLPALVVGSDAAAASPAASAASTGAAR